MSAMRTRAVLAADIFPIPTSTTATSIAAGVYVYNATESGTTTTFTDYEGNSQLTFSRGASGSGTLTCPSGASLHGCTAGATTPVTWTTRTVRIL